MFGIGRDAVENNVLVSVSAPPTLVFLEKLCGFQAAHLLHHKPGNGQAGIGHTVGGGEHSIEEYCGFQVAYTQRSADAPDVEV